MLDGLDLWNGRSLNEIQVPQQPHPHDAGHDVEPARKEEPPSRIVEPYEMAADQANQDDDQNQQTDPRGERFFERLEKGHHDSPLTTGNSGHTIPQALEGSN